MVDARRAEVLAHISANLTVSGVVPDEVFEHDIAWVVTRVFDRSLSTDERARTLETLAAMLCLRLGLQHVVIRARTEFEVDVTAERLSQGYETWSTQCKAFGDSDFTSEYVTREFGIATLNRNGVLLFVTTGAFSPDAIRVCERIIRESSVQVFRIDGAALRDIGIDETKLFDLIKRQTLEARSTRLGAEPAEVFTVLDHMRRDVWTRRPTLADLWARIQREDLFVPEHEFQPLVVAWLESQRASPEYDEGYVDTMRRSYNLPLL